MMRILVLIAGSILLALGILSMVTPIPGGTFAIAIGAGMVICTSETAAGYLQACRAKYGRFNRLIMWMETKMGERFSAPLRGTRPAADQATQQS